MGIGVAVEEVGRREPPGRDANPRDISLASELVGPVLDSLLLAAQSERLLYVQARHVEPRHRKANLLSFFIRKACHTQCITEAKALTELRVDINFGAFPRAQADKRSCTCSILGPTGSRQAIRTCIRRGEWRDSPAR
jgi:hypothetical protein